MKLSQHKSIFGTS